MHKQKIEQLEKAMNLKGATAEMKAKFQAAIDKLKGEEKKPEAPENIVSDLKKRNDKWKKAVDDFGITEVFLQDGELHITSKHDVPADYTDAIEKWAKAAPERKKRIAEKPKSAAKVKKTIADNKAKVLLKDITIHWAEGDNSKYDKFPKTYTSWEAANKAVLPVLEKGIGGYNKVKFTIVWKDKEDYQGGLDVSEKEDNPETTTNVFGEHIKAWFDWQLTSDRKQTSDATKAEIKRWLEKYDLGLDKPKEKKKAEPRPQKQAEVVKKAIAAKAPETNHAAEMQALIDNATKSGEHWQTNKVLAEAQKFEALRTKSAQTLDEKSDSKKRLSPTRENLIRWMNNPGGFDLIGVDTFEAGNATADLKIKKEVFWNRFGIHYKD